MIARWRKFISSILLLEMVEVIDKEVVEDTPHGRKDNLLKKIDE